MQMLSRAELAKLDNLVTDGMETEAQILEIIRDMLNPSFDTRLTIKDITSWLIDRRGTDYKHPATTKWIGTGLRKAQA